MLICLGRKGAPSDPPAEAGAEMEPPRPIYRQPPGYSDRARRDKLQGSVLVQVNIDSDGCAGNPTLVRGMGNELDTAAVEAAKRWVFQPATVQGRPVPADSIVSINFTKDNEAIKDPEKAYRDKLFASWPAQ
jgi:protein TonB